MPRPLSRRSLLAGATSAALGVVAGACTSGAAPGGGAAPRRSAVVVGAGLSGLTAAYDLGRAGWRVTVLEARRAVGGRIRTVRGPALPDGVHGELGGDLVHPAHEHVLSLIRQLRIETQPVERPAGADDVVCVGGRVDRVPDVRTDVVRASLAAAREVLVLHADPGVQDVSCAQAVRALDLSPLAVHLLDAEVRLRHGQDLAALSAAFVGAVLARDAAEAQPVRILGGADRLVDALVDAAGAEVRTGHAVAGIRQDQAGVTVSSDRGALRADRVVLALPASVAARLDLGGEQELAIRLGEVVMSEESRALMVTARPSWRDDRLSGTITADGPFSSTRDATPPGTDAAEGLLVVSGTGRTAADLLALSRQPGRLKGAVDACLPAEPIAPGRPAVTIDWAQEPWARGGRPGFPPGAWHRADGLRAPVGRIHVAGDHAGGDSPGTMDAAVQAGRRAAREIVG